MADILFVSPTLVKSVKSETNGIMILGTILLQNGYDVNILRYSEINSYLKNYHAFIVELTDRIIEQRPRIVSLYTVTTNFHISVRLTEEIKKRDSSIVVVFGGAYASLLSREILDCTPCLDYVCSGEGETTILPFVKNVLEHNLEELYKIPGLNYRLNGKIISNPLPDLTSDLDTVPTWDDRLFLDNYDNAPSHILNIEVGRGCPFRCAFCCNSLFWEQNYRLKNPDRVIEDIKHFHEKFHFPVYSLSHDALTANNEKMELLCDKLIEANLGVKFVCSSRVDCLTPKLIKKMQQAGFVMVQMGIETGSERMQKRINKNLDLSKAKDTVRELLKHNITPQIYFIYGFPDETREELNDTLNLMFDLFDVGARDLSVRRYKFSPKTKLCEEYYNELIFDEEQLKHEEHYWALYEEHEMILKNKAMFTNLYNLHSEVRDHFYELPRLINLYRYFPKQMRRIRSLYNTDCTKLYDDFSKNNPSLCKLSNAKFLRQISVRYAHVMLRTIRDIKSPKAHFIRISLYLACLKEKFISILVRLGLVKNARRNMRKTWD